jgi:hypothetical protein
MDEVDTNGAIFVGKGEKTALLSLAFSNRHGLVTGATGTGKTVTLQVLAEGLSRAGVPVFAADIKGDLSGISAVGEAMSAVKRAADLGFKYEPDEFPAVFWDVFGAQGHPVRATISEMGPLPFPHDGPQRRAGGRPQYRISSPTSRGCCCSISRTCARYWAIWRITPPISRRNTAT